ncbi:MAG: BACON domain-containing carbohydrate-binding protein, partial [Betaproteobacteria bacterium]
KFEEISFYTVPPAFGGCAAAYYPVYRAYNNRFSPNAAQNDGNHRITPSFNDYQRSIRFFGFADEGVAFCAPASSDAGADLQTTMVYPGTEAAGGATVKAQYLYSNNGPGKGDGGTIYMALPAAVTNWVVTCTPRSGATCPGSLDANRLREGQTIATWPAGGGLTLEATGTAPAPAAGSSATLEFATASSGGNGAPDPTPENNTPPPAQTVIRATNACDITLNPGNMSFGSTAQGQPAALTTGTGCAWTVQSDAPWLIVVGASSKGPATIAVTVQTNPGAQPRTGTLSVGGATTLVVQAGAPPPNSPVACANLRLQREGEQAPAGRRTGPSSVGVFADGECRWTSQADVSWITLTAGGAGNGNGTISYIAQPNTEVEARTANIRIADKNFVINQLGAASDSGNGGGGSDCGGDSGGGSGGDSGGGSGGDSG